MHAIVFRQGANVVLLLIGFSEVGGDGPYKIWETVQAAQLRHRRAVGDGIGVQRFLVRDNVDKEWRGRLKVSASSRSFDEVVVSAKLIVVVFVPGGGVIAPLTACDLLSLASWCSRAPPGHN